MSAQEDPIPLVERMRDFGTTVFAEMTQRALQFDAVNLGQGFPDTDGPPEVLEAAIAAIREGLNQYPPATGMPVLREAVAEHQARFHGLDVDPADVLITVGATEAIATSILALVEPGDEVVTFEPWYDSYAASIALAGGVHRAVPLRFPDLSFSPEDLRAAFGPRTKMVLINTPHNPTGKVFRRDELALIASVAREHGAWIVADEVYEHLTYDGHEHVSVATLPDAAGRALTISSGAKTFSTTGWKVGWVHGPTEAIRAIATIKQFVTFAGSAPFQPAIAAGLRLGDDFYDGLRAGMQAKRDILVEALTDAGMTVSPCQGTYFVIADAAPLGVVDAVDFCRRLPEEVGVVGVPVSAFVADRERVASLVRFAFCKRDDVLRDGAERLGRLVAAPPPHPAGRG